MFECKPTAVSKFLLCVFVTFAFGVVSGSGQCLKPGLNSTKTTFLPSSSHELSTADANGDGKPDLTYQVAGSNQVSILFGDGTGGFGAPNTYTVDVVGDTNHRVIFADLTGDGKPEMLVIDQFRTVDVWLNNGSGTFTFSNSKNHQTYLSTVVDLNGDNKGDLISILSSTPGGGSTSFRVEFGNGSGGFAAPVDYFTPGTGNSYYLFVGDFDANGKPDVVVGRLDIGIFPKLFINDGSGGLVEVPTPTIPAMAVAGVADLNNDGRSDLFGAQNGGGNFLVLINNGSNTYTSQSYAGFGLNPSELHQVVDFDGNGTKDIAVHQLSVSQGSSNVLLLNDGNGNLTRFVIKKPDFGELNADFNGDGKTDFVSLATNILIGQSVASVRTPTCARRGDPVKIDYNGDGYSEYAVWRPTTSLWSMRTVVTGINSSVQFGASGDVPAPGDYDGDGTTDFAIFRPSLGDWSILRSSNQTILSLHFGATGDKPTPGDYDGDGTSDIAVYRPSNGGWYYLNSSDGSFHGVQFGISTDVPLPVDFDGDSKVEIAVFRPSEGAWYMLSSSTGEFTAQLWGLNGDLAVPADYDGDHKADLAVFRPANGDWYFLRSFNGAFIGMHWGQNGDFPIAGFRVGTGEKPEFAWPVVYRPGLREFLISLTLQYNPVPVGATGDLPVTSPFKVE